MGPRLRGDDERGKAADIEFGRIYSQALSEGGMLELTSLDAGYGGFQALFDIALEVHSGEAVAGIGPNGAAKTTRMRVISGPIRPTATFRASPSSPPWPWR